MPNRDYEYDEIAKTIYDNRAADPPITDSQVAEIASSHLKTPVTVRRVARIRIETEEWRRRKAAKAPVDWSQVALWQPSTPESYDQDRRTQRVVVGMPHQYRSR